MKEKINFLRGDIDNFDNITRDSNNFYLTTGQTDTDYKLYIGDKLLAQCGISEDLQEQINELNNTKAEKSEIPTALSQLSTDSTNRTVTDQQINQWDSYTGVVYSDEEYIIGKWVDGRDIYRRSVIYEEAELGEVTSSGFTEDGTYSAKTNHWAYTEAFSGSNIDAFIKMEGTAFCVSDKHPNGAWQPIPRVVPDACQDYSIGIGDFNMLTGKVGVLFRC